MFPVPAGFPQFGTRVFAVTGMGAGDGRPEDDSLAVIVEILVFQGRHGFGRHDLRRRLHRQGYAPDSHVNHDKTLQRDRPLPIGRQGKNCLPWRSVHVIDEGLLRWRRN
ncbi:hypothetical protein D3C85_1485570 [compost metagenome]